MDAIAVLKKFIDLTDIEGKKVCICFTIDYYENLGLLAKEESCLIKGIIKKNKPNVLQDKVLSASYFKERYRIRNKLGYLPNQYYYFQSSDWNTRHRYLELLVKYLENERDNVLKSEFDDGLLKSIDVNIASDLDSEHLFETYKPALDDKCDEACFYGCSQGGQKEPECIEHYYKKKSSNPSCLSERKMGKGWYDMIQDELPIPNTPEESEEFLKAWNNTAPKTEVKKTLEIIYGTPGAIISRRTENKNHLDLIVLNERLDVLNKKKQYLLSVKKEFRQELPGVLDSIKRIKGWIKSLE